MLNHSRNNFNCDWVIEDDNIKMFATRNISAGEELLNNYGETYWSTRSLKEII